jgi:hypothetical protein
MKPITTMPTPLSTTNQTTELTNELQEQIRHRAHELYEQRAGLTVSRRTTGSKRKQKY